MTSGKIYFFVRIRALFVRGVTGQPGECQDWNPSGLQALGKARCQGVGARAGLGGHMHGAMHLWLLWIWGPVCERNSREMRSTIRWKPRVRPLVRGASQAEDAGNWWGSRKRGADIKKVWYWLLGSQSRENKGFKRDTSSPAKFCRHSKLGSGRGWKGVFVNSTLHGEDQRTPPILGWMMVSKVHGHRDLWRSLYWEIRFLLIELVEMILD